MTTGPVGPGGRRRRGGRAPEGAHRVRSSRRVQRRRRQVAMGGVLLLALVVALGVRVLGPSSDDVAALQPSTGSTSAPEAEAEPSDGAATAADPAETSAAQSDPATVRAGILAPGVPDVGTGAVDAVPGAVDAPDPAADVVRVRVAVEGGLPVDGAAFAAFVLAALNEPRSWVQEGYSFARTEGDADVEVVLASPQTSAQMCAPLDTRGTLSCRNGDRAVLTYFRWVNGSDDYAADPTGYRTYVVNHEVGHFLGHGHVSCPGAGEPAPVMMQQTKGIDACVTNPWPFP